MPTYEFSTDQGHMDRTAIQALIHPKCLERGVPADALRFSLRASRCVAAFQGARVVSFTRLVTDGETFAYLSDVCVMSEHRHQDVDRGMLPTPFCSRSRPPALRSSLRATRTQRRLFRQLGFQPVAPLVSMARTQHRDKTGLPPAGSQAPTPMPAL